MLPRPEAGKVRPAHICELGTEDAPTDGARAPAGVRGRLHCAGSLRPRTVAAAVLVHQLLAAGVGLPRARAQERPPEGFAVGPWVFAPAVAVGLVRDSNVFYREEESGRIADSVVRTQARLDANLLFRNSHLKLAYEAGLHRYAKVRLPGRNWSQSFSSELSLLFGTRDRLTLGASRDLGLAETQTFDPGGEAVFQGTPYTLNGYFLDLRRDVSGRRGYTLSIARQDLDFPASTVLNFFEYRGYSGRVEYLEPLSPRLSVLSAVEARRFDHFTSAAGTAATPPFRREESALGLAGLRGRLGPTARWSVLAGRAVSQFRSEGRLSEYRGPAWEAMADLSPGPSSSLAFSATRRVLPSFFLFGDDLSANDYYVHDEIGARFERRLVSATRTGVRMSFSQSRYSRPVAQLQEPSTKVIRRDRTVYVEGFGDLSMGNRVFVRLSLIHHRRTSSFDSAGFRKTIALAGIGFGWF